METEVQQIVDYQLEIALLQNDIHTDKIARLSTELYRRDLALTKRNSQIKKLKDTIKTKG